MACSSFQPAAVAFHVVTPKIAQKVIEAVDTVTAFCSAKGVVYRACFLKNSPQVLAVVLTWGNGEIQDEVRKHHIYRETIRASQAAVNIERLAYKEQEESGIRILSSNYLQLFVFQLKKNCKN